MIHRKVIIAPRKQQFYDIPQSLRQQCKALVHQLTQKFSSLDLQKQYLNCFKLYLKQLEPKDIKQALQNQLNKFQQKTSCFYQIHMKKNKRKNILSIINNFFQKAQKMQIKSQQALNQFLEYIQKLRKNTLTLIQEILKTCCVYSNRNCDKKETMIKSFKKIFKKINQQHEGIKITRIGQIINLGEGFDPLFLNYNGRAQKQFQFKACVDKAFNFDIAYSSRLIHAHNQMLICFLTKNQTCCQLDLLNSQKLSSKSKTQGIQNSSSYTSDKKQKIFNNYRKKMSKSLDKEAYIKKRSSLQSNSQVISHLRSRSNDNYQQSPKSQKNTTQKEFFVKNKLNFKAINLSPIQDRSDSSDNNGTSFRSKVYKGKFDQKSIHSLKSEKIESSKSQLKNKSINGSNYEQQQYDTNQKDKVKIRKLSDLIRCKQVKAFQTEEQNSPRNSMDLKPKIQAISCDEQIHTNIRADNRTRRITQVQGQYEDSPKRGNTPQGEDLKREIENTLFNLKEVENKLKQIQKQSSLNEEVQNNQNKRSSQIESVQNFAEKMEYPSSSVEQNFIQAKKQFEQKKNEILKKKQEQSKNTAPINNKIQKKKVLQEKQEIFKQNANKTYQENLSSQISSPSKAVKKVQMKPTKLNIQNLKKYFSSHEIDNSFDYLLQEAQQNNFYISQFYLGEQLAIIVIVSFYSQRNSYNIRKWHVLPEFLQTDKSRTKVIALAFKKYIQYLQSHTSCDEIILQEKNIQFLEAAEFQQIEQNLFVRKRKIHKKNDSSNQFLSVYSSMINFKQNIKESLLYSDQIQQFKQGKYYCNPKLFEFKQKAKENMIQNCNICFQQIQGLNVQKVNEQLQKQHFDTYIFGEQCKRILSQDIHQSQNNQLGVNLNLVKMCQKVKSHFLVTQGYIRMIGNLVYHNNNQLICSVNLTNRHKMYFGKGFEHIINMTNKIIHYKSMKNNSKQIKFWSKMFTKQLYGKVKYEQNEAIYGNWQINFIWKQEIQGKLIHSLSNQVIYGQSPFFICVQCGDQIVLGSQIHQDDFLF